MRATYLRGDATRTPIYTAVLTLTLLTISSTASAGIPPYVGLNGNLCAYDTIAEAIAAASDGDEVLISGGLYAEQPGLIDKSLILTAASSDCSESEDVVLVINDNGSPGALFRIDSDLPQPAQVTLNGLTLSDGGGAPTDEIGGLIVVENATVTINDGSLFSSNVSENGGCAAVIGGTLNINDSELGDCEAQGRGGAIWVDAGNLNITASELRQNLASNSAGFGNGGAIAAVNGSAVTLVDTIIADNTAAFRGGGIWVIDGGSSLAISGGEISGNGLEIEDASMEASPSDTIVTRGTGPVNPDGVAIFVEGEFPFEDELSLLIDGTVVLSNNASSSESAVYLYGAISAELSNCEFSNHNSGAGVLRINSGGPGLTIDGCYFHDNGRAIWSVGRDMTIINSTFEDQVSPGIGGAIRAQGGEYDIADTVFANNSTNIGGTTGGAIYYTGSDTMTIERSEFTDNASTLSGGAIQFVTINGAGQLDILDSTFSGNSTESQGGAIKVDGEVSVTVMRGSFVGNATTGNGGEESGGAIHATSSAQLALTDVQLNNNGSRSGGAIRVEDEASVIVDGSNFMANDAVSSGGAISVSGGSATVVRTRFLDHQNPAFPMIGGAMSLYESTFSMRDVVMQNNFGYVGGALAVNLSQGTIENPRFSDNQAQRGGALWLRASSVTISSNYSGDQGCNVNALAANTYCSEFRNNSAGTRGGAVFLRNGDGIALLGNDNPDGLGTSLTLENVALIGNRAAVRGAAIGFSSESGGMPNRLHLSNTLITDGATLAEPTSAIDIRELSEVVIDSTSVVGNAGPAIFAEEPDISLRLTNTLLWSNGAPSVADVSTVAVTVACNYSESEAPDSWSLGSPVDPLFVTDPLRGDFRLGELSPVLDACDTGPSSDLDGGVRPSGGGWEPGAFEVLAEPPDGDLIFRDGFD